VDTSVKGNFVQYHVENNGTEVWVLNDFNTVSNTINQLTCMIYTQLEINAIATN